MITRYHRGPASDYDRWAQLTNDPSWSYKSLLPLFKKSEHFQDLTAPTSDESDYITPHPSNTYHGRNGEWKVSYATYFHRISSYFIRAAEAVGLKYNPDFNGETTLGVGRIQTFVDARDRARSSAEKAFLNAEVRARANLSVITGATCLSVTIEDGRCTGAVVMYKGREVRVKASRQVIVSCGAFDSPRFLAASQIPLPGIGKNLQDHLGVNVSFKIPETFDKSVLTLDYHNSFFSRYYQLFRYLWTKKGPAASNLGEAVAFHRSQLQNILAKDPSSGPEGPHIEVIAVPLLTHHHESQQYAKPRHRHDFDWSRFEFTGRYITLIPLLLTPLSRGELRFKADGMEIDPNYLDDDRDLDILVEGVKFVRKIAREGYPKVGLEGLVEQLPGEQVRTDEGLRSFVRDSAETYYHPVGTCKVRFLSPIRISGEG